MRVDAICCGDCIETMGDWPPGQVDLAFADPPYNIGYVYDEYDDDLPGDQYVQWCRKWMGQIKRVLRPDGSFYLAIGDDFAAELCIVGKQLGFTLRNWIIWHYSFGQNMKAKFTRAHTHILYFVVDPKNVKFNADMLRFPSARHTEYQDLRANPDGRLPDDVWNDIPRVCGTFKERQGFHGCQLPEALLTRIIMASSDPGDLVLDPFVGSGTTVAVAKRLGRRYLGIDLSPEYVARSERRLGAVANEAAARPEGDAWPGLHRDLLVQIYRETKVSVSNLRANAVAMGVVARSLSRRCGWEYTVEQVDCQLERLAQAGELPKLPNDQPFVGRKHVTTEGKRYVRRVMRLKGRRRADASAPSSLDLLGATELVGAAVAAQPPAGGDEPEAEAKPGRVRAKSA